MTDAELKPCPFCGGGAVVSADMARYPQCACDACGACCGQGREEGVQAAIDTWNTRPAVTLAEALTAIASLPTPDNEDIMRGHEDAYRAVAALETNTKPN